MAKYAIIETPKNNIWTSILIIFIVLLVGAGIYFYVKWQAEKERANIANTILNQNQIALQDSIRVINDKFGNLLYVTYTYMSTMDDLILYNRELVDKIKKIEGNILSAIDSKITYDTDTITIDNDILKYSEQDFGLKFEYEYSDPGLIRKFAGVSKFSIYDNLIVAKETEIYEDSITLQMLYGFREVGNKYEVFAKSLSPRISFNELEGVLVLDKIVNNLPTKNSRFVWGPMGGVGYSMISNRVDIVFGVGVIYKLGGF